ncbi:MAG: serine/threonine protein kinase [Myxococcales bacterium]|nr:serine/threonine protein kinase [Myxococcales bacterium]
MNPDVEPSLGPSQTTTLVVGEEQSARARTSLWSALWLSLLAGAALQLTRNKNPAHWVLTATIVALALACAGVLLVSRKERLIPPRRMLLTGVMTVLVTLAATARLGVLTPTFAFLIVTVYYNSSGDSPYEGIIYGLSALGYFALLVLCFVGVLPLTGSVLAMVEQNDRALVGFGVVTEGMLFVTYRMAKRNRLATRTAMDRLERIERQVQQRDALLLEARADLAGANAGRYGRHTGARVAGYEIGTLLGRGAMGEVYAAKDGTGAPAAIKIMHPELLEDPTHAARFMREAELTRQLDSPHIVRVWAGGTTDDGCPFVAMELLSGEDLGQRLRERRVMELPAVAEMLQQVARGLDAAQEKGIVHRDLKPQNLFWAREGGHGSWKVLDFGMAVLGEASGELTRGAAVGTPHYMSPEQTRGEPVDHRSDVFALGAICYRALTGQPAFAASDSMAAMYRVNRVQPAKPSWLASVPPDVDRVLALALAKEKDLRFRSASTFAAAFRDAARGELDEPYRRAADALLARHPWMREIR